MKISDQLLLRIESDLGLNLAFRKGADIPVSNCWHFCTDGNAVDTMFYDEPDFIDGMNRIFLASRPGVVILAFALMDTHVHFILYGAYNDCNAFVHEYVRRTSMQLTHRHDFTRKLRNIPINCQKIGTDFYLRTAICYVLRNPVAAGLKFMPYDYPWSSGALYFRQTGYWTSAHWSEDQAFRNEIKDMSSRERLALFKTKGLRADSEVLSDRGLIFPGEYVAVEVVERLFRTCRNFNYLLGASKEEDMHSIGFELTRLSVPVQEMRQHRDELCLELFGRKGIRTLDLVRRMKLARVLRSRFRCSVKQVSRVCGLVYDEIKDCF